jgi:outer membrane protein insertion porin family
MDRGHSYLIVTIFLATVLTGCSTTRYLTDDEKLYTGADIRFESDISIPDRRTLENELRSVVRPSPNAKFLGLFRHRLWLYFIAGEEVEGGLRGWIKNRLGRSPVLLEQVQPGNTSVLMINRLQNEGYFNAEVAYEVRENNKTARLLYTVYPDHPFRLNRIRFPEEETELYGSILETRDETVLHEGDVFKLSRLREERERIDIRLKNKGFYFFNADYIRFRADSTVGDNRVDLSLTIREDAPARSHIRYRIGSMYLYPDYMLDRETVSAAPDTVEIRDKFIIQYENRFRPRMLSGLVFLEPGAYYNRQDHVLTINRLMGLGTFRFVNMRFIESADTEQPSLDVHVYLTPVNERSIRAEFRAVSKSNDLAGPGLSVGYRNRNLFRGAELFTADITSSFETQIGGGARGLDLYQIGVETELQIPRIIAPIPIYARTSLFVPRTRIRFGYDILDRVDYLRINSFSTRFGYIWMSGRHVRHELNPIGINYFRSTILDAKLENDLLVNPWLRRSLESQFIIGTTYSLYFNNQAESGRRHAVYFNFNLDLSGNTLNILQSAFRSEKSTEDQPYTLFGIPYSQYTRADIDLRYYRRTGTKSQIVSRLIAGAGIPYGNSRSMPYVKQFFIGGSNSVRAFPARSIGPGSYPPPEDDGFLIDRTGEIRIETNIEYRFPLVSVLRGAFFLDAGNIWMMREDDVREGTVFDYTTFLSELAVGAGIGFRLDISFFVLRFDIAFPLHVPYLAANERWVGGDIVFGSSRWRRENLTYTIAIGYPF